MWVVCRRLGHARQDHIEHVQGNGPLCLPRRIAKYDNVDEKDPASGLGGIEGTARALQEQRATLQRDGGGLEPSSAEREAFGGQLVPRLLVAKPCQGAFLVFT